MKNTIQHYAWGQRGNIAFIPTFLGISPEPDKPYAELWMGTHKNGPSSILIEEALVPLDRFIKHDPLKTLGKGTSKKFSDTFPFLLKILSADDALSIQAHPNKKQAEILHQEDPFHYPDDNHKPEVAIALDSLDALAGFKNYNEILDTFKTCPELSDMVSKETCGTLHAFTHEADHQKQTFLKSMYSEMLLTAERDPGRLEHTNNRIKDRLTSSTHLLTEDEILFINLEKKYATTDVGLLMIFLLKRIHLKKGEGIAITPGLPHAYLKGNIIECMANSDNVVRAGLTPKFKDTKTLFRILDYNTEKIPIIGAPAHKNDVLYHTPFEEFQISKMIISQGDKKTILSNNFPEILLVTNEKIRLYWGEKNLMESMELKKGMSVFIPACLETVHICSDNQAELYRVSVF